MFSKFVVVKYSCFSSAQTDTYYAEEGKMKDR